MARRRAARTLAATLIGGLVVTLGGVPAASAEPGVVTTGAETVRLVPDGAGVAAATVSLSGSGNLAARRTAQQTIETTGFSQVAVTWRGAAGDLEVRTRSGGVWSPWRELEPIHDGPDRNTEGNGVSGSDLLWVGEADAVRVRSNGTTPRDLALVLQQPSAEAGTRPVSRTTTAMSKKTAKSKTGVPKPPLLKRKAWGANNKWRNGKPTYTSDLKQVHIHHTATANGYTKSEVPGIMQGMYRYHTKTLGWFDLGYNFVVDRFGQTWVGRSGGAGKLVRGAHTLGFNESSVGIAVLGNHETQKVSAKAIKSVVRLAAWKLDRHNAPKAKGKVKVVSAGSDLYKSGTSLKLPAIDGHRDTNQTACPGALLYDRLGDIRRRAQKRLDRFGK